MTQSPKTDRDRHPMRRLFGSGFLIALFLVSGLAQQMHWVGVSSSEATARRDAEAPVSSDLDPAESSESESSQPTEDAPPGRDATDFENAPSVRLTRNGLHALSLPSAILPAIRREVTLRPALRPGHLNPTPRASGRLLRNWLQSHIC